MSLPIHIAIGWLTAAVMMTLAWTIQRRTHKAGIVDVFWTAGVGSMSIYFATVADGYLPRRVLVGCLAGVWSARLTWHLTLREIRLPEDGRYKGLRDKWGTRAQRNFFWFYQLQASWVVIFALPMWLAASNPVQPLRLLDGLAVFLWIVSVVGASIADHQLTAFRADAAQRGKVCRVGLWRYSRHPNYFFEWLQWWSYALLALGAPYGWLSVAGPLVMLYFLLKVTGIPPAEAQALASRGDAYRRYQEATNAFFPWKPKTTSESARK